MDAVDRDPRGLKRLFELASGGMGRVDLAVREEGAFRRLYAVKRLHPHLRADSSFRTMFVDEARVAGLIRHPNVVSVVDVGEDHEGPFLVLDYVDGISVADLVSRGKPLPVQLAIDVVAQAARGLHAAHELADHAGRPLALVHRDVSPQNLLLGFDGVVRVTDFGVAKAIGSLSTTAAGVLKGKIGYMSPEQLGLKRVDRRSDLYSLGVVLYELLAGRRLYSGGESARIQALAEPPADIGELRMDLPPELVELSIALLSVEPDLRPASAADVAQTLARIGDELAQVEGRAELSSYVRESFEAHEELRRARIADALLPTTTAGAARSSMPRNEKVRRSRAVLYGAFALLAIVATTVALGVAAPWEEPLRATVPTAPAQELLSAPMVEEPAAVTAPEHAASAETTEAVMRQDGVPRRRTRSPRRTLPDERSMRLIWESYE